MQIRSKARIKLTCKMFCCFSIICWSFELDLESNIYLTVTLGNRPGDRLIEVDHLERFSKLSPLREKLIQRSKLVTLYTIRCS